MISGVFAKLKNKCLKTECGYLISSITAVTNFMFLERVNLAVNAAIVQEAAAARALLAAQALADCRAENNPFLPGSILGPSRAAMWGPDPCLEQEKELADAQAAQRAAQISSAPTEQNLAAGPAAEFSNTWDPSELFQPETMNVDIPQLESAWSPTSLEDILEMIAVQMDVDQDEGLSEALEGEIEKIRKNMIAAQMWDPGHKTFKRPKRYQLVLKDNGWAGHWLAPG